jgi:hypothetical protein
MFFNKKHPIKGFSYAITTGTYVGEILIFVEEKNEHFDFISIPKNVNRNIPKDKFFYGMEEKIVDVVEKIPRKVFKLLEKQFEYNKRYNK